MKEELQIICILVLAFLLPMLTSWLLDWDWISRQWTRKTLVILLMGTEIAISILILRGIFKKPNQ